MGPPGQAYSSAGDKSRRTTSSSNGVVDRGSSSGATRVLAGVLPTAAAVVRAAIVLALSARGELRAGEGVQAGPETNRSS